VFIIVCLSAVEADKKTAMAKQPPRSARWLFLCLTSGERRA